MPKGVERGLLPLGMKDCFMMASKKDCGSADGSPGSSSSWRCRLRGLGGRGGDAGAPAPDPLEALENNRELRAAESRIAAAGFRITRARGLPDPMVSIGYQNEGLTNYTYGDSPDAQRMCSVSHRPCPFSASGT